MTIKNVIFDMDGTLADTAVLTDAAFKNLAPELGFTPPEIGVIRSAIGYQNPEFYYQIFKTEPAELVKKIGEATEDEEQRMLPDFGGDFLFPGVRELLNELRERKINLFIASTGSEAHVYSILNKAGIAGYFNKILCDKPEKAGMVREIIGGGDKKDFIMVGDMKKDLDAARANGITAVGACFGYCRRGSGFDHYIETPEELLCILNETSERVSELYVKKDTLSIRIDFHNKYSVNKYGFANWTFDQYELKNGMRVLELACGTAGIWAGRAEKIPPGVKIILSDISPLMLSKARDNLRNEPGFYFEEIDIQKIPHENESFGAVIANHMLYHVPDIDLALSEVRRVLKSGGKFYATTLGRDSLKELNEISLEYANSALPLNFS